jgi:hypothetical protein
MTLLRTLEYLPKVALLMLDDLAVYGMIAVSSSR